ncbi:gamma-glutamyltransferase [bacterium]|nr:gamma-glutamyltransferase [bacterium]
MPGTAAGLCRVLANYGTLPLPVVMAPAIRHAREGFPMDSTLAGLVLDSMESLLNEPELAELYMMDGFPKMEGDILVQPQLADVLQRIAERGADGFYRGETAQALADGVTRRGGSLTLEDLASFEPVVSAPVRGTYRDLEVVSAPAPHSGATLIEMLNMIEHLEFDPEVHYTQSAEHVHMLAEIFRRATADRTQYLGDPDFMRTPITAMISKDYARERLSRINPYRADPLNYRDTPSGPVGKYDTFVTAAAGWSSTPLERRDWSDVDNDDLDLRSPFHDAFNRWDRTHRAHSDAEPVQIASAEPIAEPAWTPIWDADDEEAQRGVRRLLNDPFERWNHGADEETECEGPHTTHLSVIDADSNMVALTQTLGNFFGSSVMINGILLNNGGVNFSNLSRANIIRPNKRPRSSLTPTLLFRDGAPFMSLGSPGAGRIISTVAQVIVNIADYGMDLQPANDAPRVFCDKNDDFLYLEARVGEDVPGLLARKGHTVFVLGDMDLFFGGVQMTAIWPGTGELLGSADARRGGSWRSFDAAQR